jgi:hypothetical protein
METGVYVPYKGGWDCVGWVKEPVEVVEAHSDCRRSGDRRTRDRVELRQIVHHELPETAEDVLTRSEHEVHRTAHYGLRARAMSSSVGSMRSG